MWVIAKWLGKTGQSEVVGRTETEFEVLRVLRGRARIGVQELQVGWGIGWSVTEPTLANVTMTQYLTADQTDITEPALWFLERDIGLEHATSLGARCALSGLVVALLSSLFALVQAARLRTRSWWLITSVLLVISVLIAFGTLQLCMSPLRITNARAVQPLHFRPFFEAVLSEAVADRAPELMLSNSPEVAERALFHLAGQEWPWPRVPMGRPFEDVKMPQGAVSWAAPRLRGLLERLPDAVRARGLSVYAALKGDAVTPELNGWLDDPQADVHATAIGLLARAGRFEELDRFPKLLAGLDDPWLACRVIDTFAKSKKRLAFVPALIPFLDDGALAYFQSPSYSGLEIGIPAVTARRALHSLTGVWFPFHASTAREVWSQVQNLEGTARERAIDRLVPGGESILSFEFVGPGQIVSGASSIREQLDWTGRDFDVRDAEDEDPTFAATVRVTNRSAHRVTVDRHPLHVDLAAESVLQWYPRKPDAVSSVTLEPDSAHEFALSFPPEFLTSAPEDRRLTVPYVEAKNRAPIDGARFFGLVSIDTTALGVRPRPAEDPVDEEPVDEEPVDEEPVDEEPVDEEPVDEEPVDEE